MKPSAIVVLFAILVLFAFSAAAENTGTPEANSSAIVLPPDVQEMVGKVAKLKMYQHNFFEDREQIKKVTPDWFKTVMLYETNIQTIHAEIASRRPPNISETKWQDAISREMMKHLEMDEEKYLKFEKDLKESIANEQKVAQPTQPAPETSSDAKGFRDICEQPGREHAAGWVKFVWEVSNGKAYLSAKGYPANHNKNPIAYALGEENQRPDDLTFRNVNGKIYVPQNKAVWIRSDEYYVGYVMVGLPRENIMDLKYQAITKEFLQQTAKVADPPAATPRPMLGKIKLDNPEKPAEPTATATPTTKPVAKRIVAKSPASSAKFVKVTRDPEEAFMMGGLSFSWSVVEGKTLLSFKKTTEDHMSIAVAAGDESQEPSTLTFREASKGGKGCIPFNRVAWIRFGPRYIGLQPVEITPSGAVAYRYKILTNILTETAP
jgi:hypothetical protein